MVEDTLRWVLVVLALTGAVGCGKSSSEPPGATPDDGTMLAADGSNPPATAPPGSDVPAATPGAGVPSEPSGAAGSAAAAGSGAAPIEEPIGMLPKTIPSARGLCNIDSGFPGDEACLAPPDPGKGFQVHVGPSDYNDAADVARFVMEPGNESSQCFMKKTANDEDIFYMVFEFSGRSGTHHIINTLLSEDLPEGFSTCRNFATGTTNIGNLGGASKAHMPTMPIAPENESLGVPLAAHTQAQHDMHYFNFTEAPILREFWMNVYYVEKEKVQEQPIRIMGLGGLAWNFAPIQPGTHMVYPYECPITSDGRIIQLLGHTHAHGIRETAHIRRPNGDRVKVFEQYDYLEPQIFMYDSLAQNPEFSTTAAGATSGLLDVHAGDVLEWECEVNNDSASALRYTNEVKTGEMCNIWGMTVGPKISCSGG